MSFTIAITGRPNVGKSTLFNRLIEQRKAIVDDESGVTRDRQYGEADWAGNDFTVIDTGGYVQGSDDVFEKEIRKQVHIAIEEADVILFMVDAATGITPLDEDFAQQLRQSKKPVILVANKVDNQQRMLAAAEFYALGFENLFNISSVSGSGTGELLDEVVKHIPLEKRGTNRQEPKQKPNKKQKLTNKENTTDNHEAQTTKNVDKENKEDDETATVDELEAAWDSDEAALVENENKTAIEKVPKISIVGQPNVGKSSLLNALLGQERTIVSDIAGTTRDTIHSTYNFFQKEFILIDTAGIRRKKNVHEDLEFYSVIRAVKAIEESDVVLLMIDAKQGITAQDLHIFGLAQKKGKGIVLLVNKWDTVEKETNTARDYEQALKKKLAPFTDVPIVFISAKEKQRIHKAIETALEVYKNRSQKIPTSKLNQILLPAVQAYKPPVVRGHPITIKYITQLPPVPPTFAFFTNMPNDIKTPYKNYLENQLRKHFLLTGVPVRLFFRKK